MNKETLLKKIQMLAPWSENDAFSESDWKNYIEVARQVQISDIEVIESVINNFQKEASKVKYNGVYEEDSKLFLLQRIVFELPENISANQRVSFKGWVNWPSPDSDGNVNLSWPVSWKSKQPVLIDSYAGSLGEAYQAWSEFNYFKERYKYRSL